MPVSLQKSIVGKLDDFYDCQVVREIYYIFLGLACFAKCFINIRNLSLHPTRFIRCPIQHTDPPRRK
jgi:hypothetical protein